MSPKLKNSCEGISSPEGWKFQDCKEDFVTLLRQKNTKWTVDDWRSDDTALKDAYTFAQYYDDPRIEWEIMGYDPSEGHGGGINQTSREDAVKELVCLAKFQDAWDQDKENATDVLDKCRDKFDI